MATAEVQGIEITEAELRDIVGIDEVEETALADNAVIDNAQAEFEDMPKVLFVSETAEEAEACAQADRLIRSVGTTAISQTVETPEFQSVSAYATLMEAIKCAAQGDETARRLVKNCVRTDMVERAIKAGHILDIAVDINAEGKAIQHGQLMDDVHVNALRYASGNWQMRARSEAETRNGARIERLHRVGLLDEYYFVVMSRYVDNMTAKQAKKAGFFTDTMSCAIQLTTANGKGGLSMEAAFVAGVGTPGGTPHDANTIVALAKGFGKDVHGMTATDLIDSPWLIHKSLLPNGAIDFVRYYDTAAGGKFFGEDKPQQDYLAYRELCRKREAKMASTVDAVVNRLLSEADTFAVPTDATGRLHELSQQKMVDYAIRDKTINPRVFGPAAEHIEEARFWLERGESDRFIEARNRAQDTAVSYSCPTADNESLSPEARGEGSEEGNSRHVEMHCPYCKAKVIGDPCARVLKCWDCGAYAKDGKVRYYGDGGHKARIARLRERASTDRHYTSFESK